jgi:hypothetical protein
VLERQQESKQDDDEMPCEGVSYKLIQIKHCSSNAHFYNFKEELLSRFRSNLVVTGASEFEETKWKAIKIGSLILKVNIFLIYLPLHFLFVCVCVSLNLECRDFIIQFNDNNLLMDQAQYL